MLGAERGTVPRASQRNLVRERVFCLRVQFLGVRVYDGEVRGILARARPGEIGAQGRSHQFVALRRTGRAAVQGGLEIFWQNNNGFDTHRHDSTAIARMEQGTATPEAVDNAIVCCVCARDISSRPYSARTDNARREPNE